MGKKIGLSVWQGMASLNNVPVDAEEVLLENGLLSFENPGYHLVGLTGRLDDALNSNTTPLSFQDLYEELESVCSNAGLKHSAAVRNRSGYAALDISSMGVDGSPVTSLDSPDEENNSDNRLSERNTSHNVLYNASRNSHDAESSDTHYTQNSNVNREGNKVDTVPKKTIEISPDSDSESASESPSDIILPEYPQSPVLNEKSYSPLKNELLIKEGRHEQLFLPSGWERHEDSEGSYYWHIKSGTIQREIPICNSKCNIAPGNKEAESMSTHAASPVTRSTSTSSALCELDGEKKENSRNEDISYKRRSYPAHIKTAPKDKAIRFAIRSLGWVEIAEDDLTPERSSKAVNKCIIDLSLGKNDLLDVVGRWGDGKDLFMDLDEGSLKLIDPENLTVLNTQPIHTIRVWGVGRDNGKDFAYVARDRITRKYMCHVFRCDIPARTIANTLRDICKKIMIERSLQQNPDRLPESFLGKKSAVARPTNLPTERRRIRCNGQVVMPAESFPTPMEEPKKILRVHYVGSMMVTRAAGMETLNEAIDQLTTSVPMEEWKQVNVAIAPSMITVTSYGEEKILAECRVRYLSFLGIGKNVKHCAFIVHTAQDLFIAHVFQCEPSSGALCKTVEAACKLRYQKCLDAYPGRAPPNNEQTPGRGFGATLKSVIGSLTGRKSNKDIDS